MESRRYLKRIWRVPKHRGASEAFATLTVKALRKHGWPADWMEYSDDEEAAFYIIHKDHLHDGPKDFWNAVEIALRVTARAYRVEIITFNGRVEWVKPYSVNERGEFKPIK